METNIEYKANQKHKDSIFKLLFQNEEKVIELYNAVKDTDYTVKNTTIEFNTLQDALFLNRINDISFLLNRKLVVLYEYQSTTNDNMPLRFLLYISKIFERIIEGENIYKEKLLKIPTPEFVCFYLGDNKNFPDEKILKLSDAFMTEQTNPELELTVKVININYDDNKEILKKSKTLKQYSYFISRVKFYLKSEPDLDTAIKWAINECVRNDILSDFLKSHGGEVMSLLTQEFDIDIAKKVWQEEAEKEGVLKTAVLLLDYMDERTIVEKTGLSLQEVEELKKQRKQ